mgnify:CR=1 FL=1
MEKIAIITDSTADLSEEYMKDNNIYVANLYVILDDKIYEDRKDIKADDFAAINESDRDYVAKTSATSPDDYNRLFVNIKNDGYDTAIYIAMTSKMSTTITNANLAEKNGLKVHIIDSGSVSLMEGIMVTYAVDLLKKGFSENEIVEKLNKAVGTQNSYCYFDTLKYLKAGGRIGKLAKKVSTIFNVKPLLILDGKGDFSLVKLRLTKEKAYKLIEEKLSEDLKDSNNYYMIYVSGKDDYVIDELRGRLKYIEDKAINIHQGRFGSVVSAHAGSKTFAVGYLEVD